MKKSILKIVIILICIFGFIIYYSMKTIPKQLKEYGLENYFSYKNYTTMIEFNYDKGEDFAIVLDKNNKVITTFCFNNKSIVISKLKLDKKDYKTAINKVLNRLYKEKRTNKELTITIYDNYKLLEKIEKIINKQHKKKNIKIKIIKKKSKLINKAKSLKIKEKTNNKILIELSVKSSDIINKKHKETETSKEKTLTKENAKEYSDIVYDKLLKYQSSNNILNQDIKNNNVKINTIPAKDNYYPDSDSWYYIKDGKVYAYIKYSYKNNIFESCYLGSKDKYKEGKC